MRSGTAEASERAGRVRAELERLPFPAVLKTILRRRGVAITAAVSAPLRGLDAAESAELERIMSDSAGEIARVVNRPGRYAMGDVTQD